MTRSAEAPARDLLELPTGSAAEAAIAEIRLDWGICGISSLTLTATSRSGLSTLRLGLIWAMFRRASQPEAFRS